MSGLRERLNRLRGTSSGERETDEGNSGAPEREPSAIAEASPAEAGDALPKGFREIGVELLENADGPFLLRKIRYGLPYRHGRYELGDLIGTAGRLLPIATRQNGKKGGKSGKGKGELELGESSDPIDPYKLLFLDTETTGLGVGTGNVPFMIGFGYYADGAFVVEQTLIRHPGEERAMLAYLLGHLQGKTHLVTYNGRTFDWPVLANRFILNGWRRSGEEPGHLDFLPPSRALWKNTLPSCRLGTVEEERLGIHRGDDVAGALAPSLYFQFLSDGDPVHLHGVYKHNEKDILTLASLSVHFATLLGGDGNGEGPAANEERYRTAAWLEQHGRPEASERLFDSLDFESDEDGTWRMALAARYKKMGRFDRALPIWRSSADRAELSAAPRYDAHVELAIYHEHRDKQLLTALSYAEKALELALRRGRLVSDPARREAEKAALRHRISRLRNKAAREREEGHHDTEA